MLGRIGVGALEKRTADREGASQARREVEQRERNSAWLALGPGHVHESRYGLHDVVIGRRAGHGAALSEASQAEEQVESNDVPLDILKDKEALELVRSYYAIPETQRRRLFELARVLSDVA